jgi:hypothetical protein
MPISASFSEVHAASVALFGDSTGTDEVKLIASERRHLEEAGSLHGLDGSPYRLNARSFCRGSFDLRIVFYQEEEAA